MIILNNVTKQYDNGIIAVNGVSARIEQGEFVYLIGASGSGKSTLMKLLYREEFATEGSIQVGSFDVTNIKERHVPKLRRYVGVVFQDFKLLPKLNVYENVAYALEVTGKSSRQIKKRVHEVLDLVGLRHKIHQYPSELSGGEQQRIAIARAIANKPMILIADEPTGNLDPETAMGIQRVLESIHRSGTTIVMGTHNDMIVDYFQHRVIRLEKGRIIADEYKGGYHGNH